MKNGRMPNAKSAKALTPLMAYVTPRSAVFEKHRSETGWLVQNSDTIRKSASYEWIETLPFCVGVWDILLTWSALQ